MKLNINYKHLAAEFVVVVVGVAVALAAENWRLTYLESQIEEEYIQRLLADVREGSEELEIHFNRYDSALNAARIILTYLDSKPTIEEYGTVFYELAAAGRTGYERGMVSHDVTYQELISSGQLSVIRNTQLRIDISSYYRRISYLNQNLSELVSPINQRFREVTGWYPGFLLDNRASTSDSIKRELVSNVLDDEELKADIRELHAALSRIVEIQFALAIDQNLQLVQSLQNG